MMKNIQGESVSSIVNDAARFRIGVVDVAVRSPLPWVMADIVGLYAAHRVDAPPADAPIQVQVEPRHRWWQRRCYEVCSGGEKLWTAHRAREVMPYLEWGINWRVIAGLPGYLQLHAATLSRAGKGVILAAESGAGKSTLTLGLIARGWQYASDEFALIDPGTLHLHPFPKTLCVKAGAFPLLEQLRVPLWGGKHYVKALKGRVGFVRPQDIRPDIVAEPAPARVVIFPQYVPGACPRLQPIPRAQAAFHLARSAFNRHAFGPRAMAILTALSRQADCYVLEAGDLDATCSLLDALLLGGHTATHPIQRNGSNKLHACA